MEKLQLDNDYVVLYSPDSLNYITNEEMKIFNEKVREYCEFFDVDRLKKIQIIYFDNKEKFREYVYELRGERDSLPEYAAGVFDNGLIIGYVPNNLVVNSLWYNNRLYMSSHELFHIMYKELVWGSDPLNGNDETNRIVWYDEGMAQFMCGEKHYLDKDDEFIKFFEKVRNGFNYVTNLNEISHINNNFKTDDYSGYDLSYLAVRYLYDTMSKEEFKSLVKDIDKVRTIGVTVLEDAIKYYKDKYNLLSK